MTTLRHSEPKESGGSSHLGYVVLQAASTVGEYGGKAPTFHDRIDGTQYGNTATTWTWIVDRDSRGTKDKHQCYWVRVLDFGADLPGWP